MIRSLMRSAVPVGWLLVFFCGLIFAVLAYSGIYQVVVVTVPGAAGESGYAIAYRLNRFTGSMAVCDANGCDLILGSFGHVPKSNKDEGVPLNPTPERAM
jgi:hypothetical protein